MNDLELWRKELQQYYNLKYFMESPNNWQELANAAVERDYLAEVLRRNKSNTLPEVTVTAKGNSKPVNVAVESDLTPSELKTLSTPDKARARYNDYLGRKYAKNAQHAANVVGGILAVPAAGIAAAPIIGSGIAAGLNGYAAFLAAHPVLATGIDAAFTADGIRNAFSNNGVLKTYRLAKEGKYGRAALSGAVDVLDLAGAAQLINLGRKIANPVYRSAWAYNTIPNWGYKKHLERADNWVRGLLSGTSPNVSNEAEWLTTELRKDLIENGAKQYGYLSALFSKNKNAAIEIAARGRDDASRLYNRLPLRNGYYIKNADGSYSYNLAKIEDDWKKLSGEEYFPLRYDEFYPEGLATSGHHGVDVITGGGGNLTGNDFIGRVTVGNFPNEEEFAIKLIEDVQDVHPFRREDNQLSKMLQSFGVKEKEKLQKKADSLYTSIYDTLNKGADYGQTPLGKLWYDWLGGRALNKLRYSRPFRLPGTHYDNATDQIVRNNFWKWADAKMKDFELGKLTGARPFLMRTEIPTTLTYKPTLGLPQIGADAQTVADAWNSLKLKPSLTLGHHSDNYVIPGIVPPINKYLDLNSSIVKLNLKQREKLNYLKFFK